MAIATFDPSGLKVEEVEKTNLFTVPADKVVRRKSARLVEFDEQQITVSGALSNAVRSHVLQWYASKLSSTANPFEVLVQEDVALVPHQPSEGELLDSWERYLEEHWDDLVAQYKGKYVAIWNNSVYDSDKDLAALAERVYKDLGYRPIFMPYIGDKKQVYEFTSSA